MEQATGFHGRQAGRDRRHQLTSRASNSEMVIAVAASIIFFFLGSLSGASRVRNQECVVTSLARHRNNMTLEEARQFAQKRADRIGQMTREQWREIKRKHREAKVEWDAMAPEEKNAFWRWRRGEGKPEAAPPAEEQAQ